jgi:hypothetical protein
MALKTHNLSSESLKNDICEVKGHVNIFCNLVSEKSNLDEFA